MHNAKCKVQNYGVGFADDFNWSRSDTFILHSAFCILHSKQTAGRGSDATAASGGKRELSEWLRSIADAAAPSARKISGTATGNMWTVHLLQFVY